MLRFQLDGTWNYQNTRSQRLGSQLPFTLTLIHEEVGRSEHLFILRLVSIDLIRPSAVYHHSHCPLLKSCRSLLPGTALFRLAMLLSAVPWDSELMAQSQSRKMAVFVQSGSPNLVAFQGAPCHWQFDVRRRSGHSVVLFGLQGLLGRTQSGPRDCSGRCESQSAMFRNHVAMSQELSMGSWRAAPFQSLVLTWYWLTRPCRRRRLHWKFQRHGSSEGCSNCPGRLQCDGTQSPRE